MKDKQAFGVIVRAVGLYFLADAAFATINLLWMLPDIWQGALSLGSHGSMSIFLSILAKFVVGMLCIRHPESVVRFCYKNERQD